MTTTGEQDMTAHSSTYSGFVSLMKYGTIISLIVGLFVVILIAK